MEIGVIEMKIVTKGKGIEEWSFVEGSMRIAEIETEFHIKCDSYPNQFVIIFEDYEIRKLKHLFKEKEGR